MVYNILQKNSDNWKIFAKCLKQAIFEILRLHYLKFQIPTAYALSHIFDFNKKYKFEIEEKMKKCGVDGVHRDHPSASELIRNHSLNQKMEGCIELNIFKWTFPWRPQPMSESCGTKFSTL